MNPTTKLLDGGATTGTIGPSPAEDAHFEASLGRILSHGTGAPFCLITSWRRDNSKADNSAAMVSLRKLIRELGYGFIQVEGVSQHAREGRPHGVLRPPEEAALLVVNHNNSEGFLFLPAMLALADRFYQPGIVYAPGDGSAELLTRSGTVDAKFQSVRSAAAEFFTRLRGGEAVTLKSIRRKPSASNLEAWSRKILGEGLFPTVR